MASSSSDEKDENHEVSDADKDVAGDTSSVSMTADGDIEPMQNKQKATWVQKNQMASRRGCRISGW